MSLAWDGSGGKTQLQAGPGGNVLLMSLRRVAQLVAYCIEYEFEDVIAELTGADRLDVGSDARLELQRRVHRYTRMLSGSRRIARRARWLGTGPRLERDYTLFFPVFNHVHELPALAALPDWRSRCQHAACFISEVWMHKCPAYLLDFLAGFDHVFIGVKHSVEAVARLTGLPCSYLPVAADVPRFAPGADAPARLIDVCNIGRRSQVTHAALLELAQNQKFFYYYDTVAASGVDLRQRTFRVQNPREHRLLLASLLKRTRYYVANRGFVNDPGSTQDLDELSARYYEGTAAGAVLIGVPPGMEEFSRQFDWQDAIIRMPFDCPEVGALLSALEADPARVAGIRARNVHHAALRHDWLYRLRIVYDTFGLAPTEAMQARERRLQNLAAQALSPVPAEGGRRLVAG